MTRPNSVVRRRRQPSPISLGPIADLESHLPEQWWRSLFGSLYLKTDGDVVENDINTEREIDTIIAVAGLHQEDRIVDLCCGQGRHTIELARRNFRSVIGIDRSRYLVRLARKRAQDRGLAVSFREGDARYFRFKDGGCDAVLILGNSFGYFANQEDDRLVLQRVLKTLRPSGTLVLDVTDGAWIAQHFEPRSWEWIDQHQFVCRERRLSGSGDRLISREVIVNDERGVIADQFYAERLYSAETLSKLLTSVGFRDVRLHGDMATTSSRDQDLGMMGKRLLFTAVAPRRETAVVRCSRTGTLDVAVLLGDPRLPDSVKRDGQFNAEDMDTVRRLKEALAHLPGYRFRYLDNHLAIERELVTNPPDLVFNLCDEGWQNDPFKEAHVPAWLEMHGLAYTGAGPSCLALCYDKALVRAVAQSMDVPVPLETYVRSGDHSATLPSVFPALLKPNYGDSSVGITANAVVSDFQSLLTQLEELKRTFPDRPILVQEFLTGDEFSVGIIGNTERGLRTLPVLQVDYSRLPDNLPRILGYESKWLPDSPFWKDIRYIEATVPEELQAELIEHSTRLFERLGCRDYARFDFRAAADGTIKLLEVNPNPGWCWDGKFNLMAEMAGMSYTNLLASLLEAACDRLGLSRNGSASRSHRLSAAS